MQIQTDYNLNTYFPSAASDKTDATADQDQSSGKKGIETPEYKAFLNKASVLLSNPHLSASEKTKIQNMLSRGQIAAGKGSTVELNALLNEIKTIDPGVTVKKASSQEGTSTPQTTSKKQDEASVTYQDQSGDADVSFKSPVSINEYQAPLAVTAHEGEHVVLAQARALINDENVTTYVAIHNGYDSNGRLIITGGTTTTITHTKPITETVKTGNKVDITV